MPQHNLTLPDLGFGNEPITVSVWLVETGRHVVEGDRLVEVLAGAATVDLPAPASGVLVKKHVHVDERVYTAQVLGVIASDD